LEWNDYEKQRLLFCRYYISPCVDTSQNKRIAAGEAKWTARRTRLLEISQRDAASGARQGANVNNLSERTPEALPPDP